MRNSVFFCLPGSGMTLMASKFVIILEKVTGKLNCRYEGCISKNLAAIPLLVKIAKNKGFWGPHERPSVMTFTKI